MARDFTTSPPTQAEINRLGFDIDASGLATHGSKSVPQFVQYLKSEGLSDDEVEYTLLKNFGTTSYNVPTDTTLSALKPISPQAIRKKGVKKAEGYEQIFFSPQERAKAGVPYVPAPAPVVAPPTPVVAPTAPTEAQLPAYPTMEEEAEASGSQEAQDALAEQRRLADEARGIKVGPPPEYNITQLARPLGFAAGATVEAGKLALALPAALAAGISQVTPLPDITTSQAIQKAEEKLGFKKGELKPATVEALKGFAAGVEEQVDKGIVDAAASEGSDIIGGLATMLFRDVFPVMPTKDKTLEQQFEAGFESGEQFTAGFPVMATFGLAVGKEFLSGNFEEAARLASAKPITLALILLPMIKKGTIVLEPRARAWVERTAGRYYAARGKTPPVAEPTTPAARATAEARAVGERTVSEPTAQATPAETAMVETAVAEAKAKQAAVGEAFTKAVEQAGAGRGVEVPAKRTIRQPMAGDVEQPLGITAEEIAIQEQLRVPARTEQIAIDKTIFDKQVSNPDITYDAFKSKLAEQVPEDIFTQAESNLTQTPKFKEAYSNLRRGLLEDTEQYRTAKQLGRQDIMDTMQNDILPQVESIAAKTALLDRVVSIVQDRLLTKQEKGIPESPARATAAVRGIEGEKALFETTVDPDVITRQVPPNKVFVYDPQNKTVRVSEGGGMLTTESPAFSLETDLFLKENQSVLDSIAAKRPDAYTVADLRVLAKAKGRLIQDAYDVGADAVAKQFENMTEVEIARRIREVNLVNKARKSGYLTETMTIPVGEPITAIIYDIRNRLVDRFSKKQVAEGVGKDIVLSEAAADQVSAAAFDVLAEAKETLFQSKSVQKKVIDVLVEDYNIDRPTASKFVEAVALESQKGLRTPATTLQIAGETVLDVADFDNAVTKAYEGLVAKDPKLKTAIADQIRQESQKRMERFVFNETLREGAANQTITIEPTQAGLRAFSDSVVGDVKNSKTVRPVIDVTEPRIFEETVNRLKESTVPEERLAGEILSRYETPSPELVQAGIVPETAKVSRGFNESMTAIAKVPKQFQVLDRVFGNYKRNLTSRNLLSGVNNISSNILLETLYYGKPTVILDVLNPTSKLRQAWTRFKDNKPATPQEASLFQAIRTSDVLDTSLIDVELALFDDAGIVTQALEKAGTPSKLNLNIPIGPEKPLGKLARWFDAKQDQMYKFGDNIFKFRSMLTEIERAQSVLDSLPVGESVTIESGMKTPVKLVSEGRGKFSLDGKVLSEEQLQGILSRAGARIAANKFVDYSKRPLYLNKLEELRYGPFGGPLITPFLTWQYKMIDGVMPYVSTGKAVRPGATAPLPARLSFVGKPGIGAAFTDSVIRSSSHTPTNLKLLGDVALEGARRAAIFGAAENISAGEEDMVRKGLSFSGRKNDPATTYLNQADPRIIYGKNWAQQNFFNPSLSFVGAVETLATEGLPDSTLPRRYRDRRLKGETLDASDIAELAGYGGSTVYDMYKKLEDASASGATSVIPEIVKLGVSSALGGTYGKLINKYVVDELTGYQQRQAGRKPVDPKEIVGPFGTFVREMLGMGYKEAYLYGSLRSQQPAEVLDKVYKQYERSLYNQILGKFTKELTLAKEQGASDAQLEAIRNKHQVMMDEYRRISKEIADNYREIVLKAKSAK